MAQDIKIVATKLKNENVDKNKKERKDTYDGEGRLVWFKTWVQVEQTNFKPHINVQVGKGTTIRQENLLHGIQLHEALLNYWRKFTTCF